MHAPDDKTPTKKSTTRVYRTLNDAHVSALRDFDLLSIVWDRTVPGLRVRVGKHRATWTYFKEHRIHGRRSATCKTLGHFPPMTVAQARQAALSEAGKIADRQITPGKRRALKLGQALDNYVKLLRSQSARGGRGAKKGAPPKPPRHADNVEKLRRQFFEEFELWPLADLSNSPSIVADWHEKNTEAAGPISANRAAEVLRACYRHALKLDRQLPPALPTSGIVFNSEHPHGGGMAPREFPKWADAWRAIKSPVHRAFALANLLTGCRPGELARLQRADILPRERVFIIRAAKAGDDIRVPLSRPILRAFRMALAAGQGPEVFPGCAQAAHRLALPARGVELRRTYRTVAADCEVDEMLAHFLLGHAPTGISQRYVARMILASGPAMRAAQRKISARMMQLLGLRLTK